MAPSRRTRRKQSRARGKRTRSRRQLSLTARLGLALVGTVAVICGVALLTHGDLRTAARLGRIGGTILILGLVALGLSLLGKL